MNLSRVKSLLVFLIAVVVVGGCRPRDPMDWKVSASSPDDFNDWCDRTSPLLPAAVRVELARAIQFVQGDSGLSTQKLAMSSQRNPFCRRINRQTVRQVILDGCFAEKTFLSRRVLLETENIFAVENRLEGMPPESADRTRLEKSIAFKHELIGTMEMRVAEITARAEVLGRH